MTKAGLLRAHLASRGSSRREQCQGSGGHSARWAPAEGIDASPEIPSCSPAAASAVRSEWELADSLYREYLAMTEVWACDDDAAESVRMAQHRAVERARELESMYRGWQYTDERESA